LEKKKSLAVFFKQRSCHEERRDVVISRIGGNFMIAFTCTNIRMADRCSVIPAIEEHRDIFGKDVLQNIGTDKGYYSKDNIRDVQRMGINADGIQRPSNVKSQLRDGQVRQLKNRRAGIEPLIGHVKEFGLKQSKQVNRQSDIVVWISVCHGFQFAPVNEKNGVKNKHSCIIRRDPHGQQVGLGIVAARESLYIFEISLV